MKNTPHSDLASILAALDPAADLAHRHLWLIHLLDWVRGKRDSVPAAVGRVQLFIDAVAARPDLQQRLQAWWATLVGQVDITTLLADFGFAPRPNHPRCNGRAKNDHNHPHQMVQHHKAKVCAHQQRQHRESSTSPRHRVQQQEQRGGKRERPIEQVCPSPPPPGEAGQGPTPNP